MQHLEHRHVSMVKNTVCLNRRESSRKIWTICLQQPGKEAAVFRLHCQVLTCKSTKPEHIAGIRFVSVHLGPVKWQPTIPWCQQGLLLVAFSLYQRNTQWQVYQQPVLARGLLVHFTYCPQPAQSSLRKVASQAPSQAFIFWLHHSFLAAPCHEFATRASRSLGSAVNSGTRSGVCTSNTIPHLNHAAKTEPVSKRND